MAGVSQIFSFPSTMQTVKSIQTGYLTSVTGTAGSGEDVTYADITIAPVNVSKSFVVWQVGNSNAGMMCRLLNSTTVRVSHLSSGITLAGRWQVIEGV